jgi:hypothetical protein
MQARLYGRLAAIPLTSAVLLIVPLVGCGGPVAGDHPAGLDARSSAAPAVRGTDAAVAIPVNSSISTISGTVTVWKTGAPYPGVSVEFKNLSGENVHVETDANGTYSLPVPTGVYTALAVDLNNENAGFDVVGRSSNAVSVPPSTRVDFEGYQIVAGGEPVP